MVLNDPSNFTTDEEIKFVPFTVISNCASPTVLEVGKIEVVVGVGLRTWNTCELLMPPPGAELNTVIRAEEVATNKSVDKIVAVS